MPELRACHVLNGTTLFCIRIDSLDLVAMACRCGIVVYTDEWGKR